MEELFMLAETARNDAIETNGGKEEERTVQKTISEVRDDICPDCKCLYVYDYTEMVRTCTSCGKCERASFIDGPIDEWDTYDRCGPSLSIYDNDRISYLKIDTKNTKSVFNAQRLFQMSHWGNTDPTTRQHMADLQVLETHNVEISPSGTRLLKDFFQKRKCVRGSSRKAVLAAICFWDKTISSTKTGGTVLGGLRPSMFAKRFNVSLASVTDALRELENMIQSGELKIGGPIPTEHHKDVSLLQSNDPIDYMQQVCGNLSENFCGSERHLLTQIRRRCRNLYEICKDDPVLEHKKPHTIMCAIVYLSLEQEDKVDEKKLLKKIPIARSSLFTTCKMIRDILSQKDNVSSDSMK